MNKVKAPDLNAPRYRRKTEGTLNAAFIRSLRENVAAAAGFSDEQLKEMILAYNTKVWETVVRQRDGVELAEQLGHVFVGSCPPKKGVNPDYRALITSGQVIQHKNYDTDGYVCKVLYTTHAAKYRFKNHELWGFEPARRFSRSLAKAYRENWKKYVMVNPRIKIETLFRKDRYKVLMQQETALKLEHYNELDL